MPQTSLPKIDVLLTILKRLDAGEKLTTGQLAEELSVTERSIYRYLETLQAAGYPIYFDRKLKSYRFIDTYKLQNSGCPKEVTSALDLRRQMLRSSSVGIAAYRIDGSCILVNSALAQMVHATKKQIFSQNLRDLGSLSESGLFELARNAIQRNQECSADLHLSSSGGKELWVHCIVTPFSSNGEDFIFVMAHDISSRKQNELALSTLVSSISKGPSLLVITDLNGTIEYVSDKITRITGYSREEVVGGKPSIFKSGLTPTGVYENMWECITSGLEWSGELCNRRKSGRLYWEHLCISPVFDADNSIKRFVAVKEDVSLHKQLEDELFRHATSDSLTGLYNRRMLIELANREISLACRQNTFLAVLLIDIDQLKKINNDFGHGAGDETVRGVAQACRLFVRNSDIMGRTGGDEFVVVLTGDDSVLAMETAERLRTTIAELPIAWNRGVIRCTASIGVVMHTDRDAGFELLLEQAGQAAHRAHRNGMNRVVQFTGSSRTEA